jgi:hypothetical protein
MTLLDAQPAPPRFTEQDTTDGVRVVVPAVKNCAFVVAVPLLLAAMTWAVLDDIGAFQAGADAGALTWVRDSLGAIGAVILFARWVWMVLGSEVFRFHTDHLEIRRELLRLGCGNTFVATEIFNIRFRPEEGHPLLDLMPYHLVAYRPSALVFDYGGRTYVFARGLDGTEVDRLISLVQQHLPLQPTQEQIFSSPA